MSKVKNHFLSILYSSIIQGESTQHLAITNQVNMKKCIVNFS